MTKKIHIIGAGDQRMPVSGMKVKQAINDARRWWNKEGREYARRNRDRPDDGVRNDEEIMSKSGIQSGEMFDALDKREKNDVVRRWHHAWCAMELGIDLQEYLRRAQLEIFGAGNGKTLDTESRLH